MIKFAISVTLSRAVQRPFLNSSFSRVDFFYSESVPAHALIQKAPKLESYLFESSFSIEVSIAKRSCNHFKAETEIKLLGPRTEFSL